MYAFRSSFYTHKYLTEGSSSILFSLGDTIGLICLNYHADFEKKGLLLLSSFDSLENAVKDLCIDTKLGEYLYLVQNLFMSHMEIACLFHSDSIMGLVLMLQLSIVCPVQPSIGFFER